MLTCQSDEAKRKERKEAFEIIETMSQKSRTALFNLGWMLEHGICTDQDMSAALAAYEQSAKKGSPHAHHRLSQLYQNGQGVTQDTALAETHRAESLAASKRVIYHNMMTTFMDLPYIVDYRLQDTTR